MHGRGRHRVRAPGSTEVRVPVRRYRMWWAHPPMDCSVWFIRCARSRSCGAANSPHARIGSLGAYAGLSGTASFAEYGGMS